MNMQVVKKEMPMDLDKRVLVVDDSSTERKRLNALLTNLGYSVAEACDGKEALQLLANDPIQLVISDQVMPNLDGKSLCKILKTEEMYGSPYIIMLTAQEDSSELVSSMDAGADDFLRKPAQKDELRVRLASGANVIAMRERINRRNKKLNELVNELREAHHRNEEELQFAAQLQHEYVPEDQWLSPTMQLASHFATARGIGGDSMGYATCPSGQTVAYQIDVMGHGVASAMLSFTLQNAIQQMLSYYINQGALPPLHQIIRRLNERFPSDRFSGLYFTMILVRLDEANNKLTYCQAGHPHPCVISPEGEMLQTTRGSFPVGMFDFADFETRTLPFLPGSVLMLSSDGLFDIINENNDSLGRKAIEKLLIENASKGADEILDVIKSAAESWSKTPAPEDDVSVMLIKRNASTTPSDSMVKPFKVICKANEQDVDRLVDNVYQHLKLNNIDEMVISKVRTSLAELLNNFVEHTVWPDDLSVGPIELTLSISNSWIEIGIVEYSVELPNLCPPRPFGMEAEGGRGQLIMMAWIDQISTRREQDANRWRLRYKNKTR